MRPKILLGVTGSVAARLTPKLVEALQEIGEVQIVATQAALYFWDFDDSGAKLWTEEEEWPRAYYVRGQDIPHVTLGDWADVLVVAPLTANTLAKLALGLADNLLTCVYRAWPAGKPVVFAPAMNTRMWQNRRTREHVAVLEGSPGHHHVPPVDKRLACGTTGIGAMADIEAIKSAVRSLFP